MLHRLQVDVPGWPESVYTYQLILCLWCSAHRSQYLCGGRPGYRSVKQKTDLRYRYGNIRMWKMERLLYRDQLRLHPGVPPQHRDLASHQAHVDHRPLQNSLRRPAYRQLSTVPPPAQSGHVPDQTLTPLSHMVLSSCFRCKLKDFLNTKISQPVRC